MAEYKEKMMFASCDGSVKWEEEVGSPVEVRMAAERFIAERYGAPGDYYQIEVQYMNGDETLIEFRTMAEAVRAAKCMWEVFKRLEATDTVWLLGVNRTDKYGRTVGHLLWTPEEMCTGAEE